MRDMHSSNTYVGLDSQVYVKAEPNAAAHDTVAAALVRHCRAALPPGGYISHSQSRVTLVKRSS
eukprot:7162331-Pyramimonas_sp.AAC.1